MRELLRQYAEARRGPCPSAAELVAYVDHGERYDEIADHLACCPVCVERMQLEIDWRKLVTYVTDNEGRRTDIESRRDAMIATIPKSRLAELQTKVAEYNARAGKLGVEGFSLTVGAESFELVDDGADRYNIKMVEIELTGEDPHFDGWRLLAAVDRLGDTNIMRVVPGCDGLVPEEYRTRYVCDHCGYKRQRNSTYVLGHDDGRLVQVGSTCIKDFLPGVDAEGLIARALALYSMTEPGDSEEYGSSERYESLKLWLSWVAATIDVCGWVSKGKADPPNSWSTSDMTGIRIDAYLKPKPDKPRVEPPTDENRAEAAAAVEFVRAELAGTSDYYHNMRAVFDAAHEGYFDLKYAGLVTSAIPVYRREMQRRAEADLAGKVSEWQGEVKRREVFELTALAMIPIDGDYGTTYITKMVDSTGNVFVWFASREPDFKLGETVTLKATVKAHNTRDGVKQTIVTRCAVV